MRRRGLPSAAACALALGLVLAGCTSSPSDPAAPTTGSVAAASSSTRGPSSSPVSGPSSSPRDGDSGSDDPNGTDDPGDQSLPRGGREILGHYRIVADYGTTGGSTLGILGAGTPEQAAERIEQRAAGYQGYGLPVQPAMELIATVAQGSAGPDGDYSSPIPMSVVEQYLRVAHEHKMLLVLDLQPGRASFLSEVKLFHHVLLDPSVEVGLDPEWKVHGSETPGNGLIGSSGPDDINDVIGYLHGLVETHHLPDKLVIVHQFTLSMLPDRSAIAPQPGVEVAFHADGFGHPSTKKHVYHQLQFPGRPFGTGFKLFLKQDSRLMSPAEVMRLHPRPDIVTYE